MQRLRDLIRAGLRASGWELRPAVSAGRVTGAPARRSAGNLVEFAGPSGIGKTTLCRQIAPQLRRDWFFEAHAAALLRGPASPVSGADDAYLARLHAHRLDDLARSDTGLVKRMLIVRRMSEVIAQAAAARAPGLPRGFILDDSVAHFFAEAMLARPRAETAHHAQGLAFVFLLPPEFAAPVAPLPDPAQADSNRYQQCVIYRRLHDLLADLGRPVLLLSSADRHANPARAQAFIAGLCPP